MLYSHMSVYNHASVQLTNFLYLLIMTGRSCCASAIFLLANGNNAAMVSNASLWVEVALHNFSLMQISPGLSPFNTHWIISSTYDNTSLH